MNWSVGAVAALALLASPAAAAAQTRAFCEVLDVVKRAAGEAEPFSSLKVPGSDPGAGQVLSRVSIPGLEGHCQVARVGLKGAAVPSLMCHRSLSPSELTARGLVEATASCLNVPAREAEGRVLLEAPPLRISIDENGTERSHVGRTVSYLVQVPAAPR